MWRLDRIKAAYAGEEQEQVEPMRVDKPARQAPKPRRRKRKSPTPAPAALPEVGV